MAVDEPIPSLAQGVECRWLGHPVVQIGPDGLCVQVNERQRFDDWNALPRDAIYDQRGLCGDRCEMFSDEGARRECGARVDFGQFVGHRMGDVDGAIEQVNGLHASGCESSRHCTPGASDAENHRYLGSKERAVGAGQSVNKSVSICIIAPQGSVIPVQGVDGADGLGQWGDAVELVDDGGLERNGEVRPCQSQCSESGNDLLCPLWLNVERHVERIDTIGFEPLVVKGR